MLGEQKEKEKNGKIPVRCNVTSLLFGIIIKAFISTAPLTSQPQAEFRQSVSLVLPLTVTKRF